MNRFVDFPSEQPGKDLPKRYCRINIRIASPPPGVLPRIVTQRPFIMMHKEYICGPPPKLRDEIPEKARRQKKRWWYYSDNILWVIQLADFPSEQSDKNLPKRYCRINNFCRNNITPLTSSAWIDSLIFSMKNREKYHSNVHGEAIVIPAKPASLIWFHTLHKMFHIFMFLLFRQHPLSKSIRWFSLWTTKQRLTQKILSE